MPKDETTKKSDRRTICWFSCGAASAVATKLTLTSNEFGPSSMPVYCETGAEHADNKRFMGDCETWFGKEITRLQSDKYADTWSVWEHRRYISGIAGAPCTGELKIKPRLAFERPDDIHVFGYTYDANDIRRSKALVENWPDLDCRFPLIERGITKAACLAMVKSAGIEPPITYALGFPNANCIPCCKATSPAYWALVRLHFPDEFERMVKLSRELGVRLARIGGERIFINEIPLDHPTTKPIAPECDFLCQLAEQEFSA